MDGFPAAQHHQQLPHYQGTASWPPQCAPSLNSPAVAPASSYFQTATSEAQNARSVANGRMPCDGLGVAATPGRAPERVYGGWPESSLQDRRLLVGWMMELTCAAGMQRETLYLAASLLDRFLASSWGSSVGEKALFQVDARQRSWK
jgi:hypothetical protein